MPKRKREAAEEVEKEEEPFSATDSDTEDGGRGKDGDGGGGGGEEREGEGEAPARKLSKKALYAQRFRTEKQIAKGKRQLARVLKRARRFEHLRLAKRIKRCEAGEDAGAEDKGNDGVVAGGGGGSGGGSKDQTKLARLQREMAALKVRKHKQILFSLFPWPFAPGALSFFFSGRRWEFKWKRRIAVADMSCFMIDLGMSIDSRLCCCCRGTSE